MRLGSTPLWFLGMVLPWSISGFEMDMGEYVDTEPISSNMTLEEYYATKGQGYEGRQRNIELACIIKARFLGAGETLPPATDEVFGDIIYSYEQLVQMEKATRDIQPGPQKRKIRDFTIYRKWNLRTEYTYEANTFTALEKSLIDQAVNLWNSLTCIQLTKRTAPSSAPYLSFQRADGGCWSYVGRFMDTGRQPINLGPGCFEPWRQHRFGIAVHEIGHALGLPHEQSRTDRDDFVDIHLDNIVEKWKSQFAIWNGLDQQIQNAVPYDVSSVMHYGPTFFRKSGAGFTVTAKDELASLNLGQGYRPTFFDAKAINMAYCSASCPVPVYDSCVRGGYQDPKNCAVCRCLEGWTGPLCRYHDIGTFGQNPSCPRTGHRLLMSNSEDCIDIHGSHFDGSIQECNWHIELKNRPSTDTIDFWITDIDLYESGHKCFDFVEVKYKQGLDTRGPRFCSRQPADGADGSKGHFVTSETNEISVHFTSFVKNYSPRFKMCYRMTPRCSMTGINGHGVISATHLATSAPTPAIDVKATLAELGADNDPCKIKVVVRTNTQGDVDWAAVSLGMHPNQNKFAKKYNKNYAFNLHGNVGVWERGAQIKGPIEIKSSEFPVSWDDGLIFATIEQIVPLKQWRMQAKCGTKKLLEFEFGKNGDGNIELSFGKQTGWNGKCF